MQSEYFCVFDWICKILWFSRNDVCHVWRVIWMLPICSFGQGSKPLWICIWILWRRQYLQNCFLLRMFILTMYARSSEPCHVNENFVKITLFKLNYKSQVTRRYAEFAASILTLNQGYDDALLIHRLANVTESTLCSGWPYSALVCRDYVPKWKLFCLECLENLRIVSQDSFSWSTIMIW